MSTISPIGSRRGGGHAIHRGTRSGRSPALLLLFLFAAALAAIVGATIATPPRAEGAVAPVGQGFTVTAGDLHFILKQIKIAERHATTYTPDNPCGTLVGSAPDQIPDTLTSYGLRTVDGSCNNLIPGREKFAAADVPFPRLTPGDPVFKDAEPAPPGFPPQASSSYKQKKGFVYDSQPRTISNLIVDQTSTNPAAIAAAEFPVRSQNNPGLHPCTTDPDPLAVPPVEGVPAGCVPSHQTLFIPNVTTDVGLSPPYNSLFTFFGQFFDHGVDQTVKSGGTVFVPLKADDPLRTLGPDGKAGTGDEVPASQAFMVLTRAQNQPGPDGILGDDPATPNVDESADDIQNANNTDTPWVDQSQTYTSHASHQVFLREYTTNPAGKPVSTGKLLGGLAAGATYLNSPDGTSGMATWASVKKQAADLLGLKLVDRDVTNIPMIASDPYGKFIPGPNGLPQYVTKTGLVEGNLASPVPVPANVLYFDTPFLTDIAHNADPSPQDTDNNPATPPVAPVPDADNTPSADFAHQPPGTYDDEMLNAHFCAGDGRVNENIALTTIHQIFHSEHDRLVTDIDRILNTDTAVSAADLADWKAVTPFTADGRGGYNYGERLFQAARFITEMEYQHLVFEEFARKVVPAIRPFHLYHTDINAAIPAEFAHAVYRFGHSMLDDDVARTNVDPATGAKTDNSIPLLTAFLNPPEYFNGHAAGTLTPERAAGSVVMGSSDQIGNELDEFVVETLRNNLLGLPLDLPTLNMTRARDAGVPPLNVLRRKIFATTHDGQLAPYKNWSDFRQHLKHPESLINFVAAYGRHPSITSETTLAGKRAAAKAIVDPGPTDTTPVPADAAEFMFSTGAWVNDADGNSTTGLDDVDLWVGGLSEVTNLFGGLLGSTFNYVFQHTLENLQDGDRLYYLARTPGLNLRTQLEGNSFAEMIERNTEGTSTLKSDAFATADCKFELGNLFGTADAFGTFGATVADDPASTDCDESLVLTRQSDGTIEYKQRNTVDPSGINGQAVYNGAPGDFVDRVQGGNDNDTVWGGLGNDRIDGQGGDDVVLGGEGNDQITDLDGADTLKGGPGNDAIDGGAGDDLVISGDGKDLTLGGTNDNETFAGPGNDFVNAGEGADAVFGDGGDDWIQGGSGQDLLQGDHGAPFFDDPGETQPGSDVFVGQVGENDYDAEGGDDLMAQNAAIDRNAGAGGFDWAFHQYDTVGADDDMMINQQLAGVPIQVVVNRDRWQETEADSGSKFDDVIRGDDEVPAQVGGAGMTGCDVLDRAGLDRISGLEALLPPSTTAGADGPLDGDLAAVVALSVTNSCPLSGPIWGEGNILLGGGGSDSITGRGGDDVIDGDKSIRASISVRNHNDHALEIGNTDLMEHQYLKDAAGNPTGPTLQDAVFNGTVDPGDLEITRQIVDAPAGDTGVDTAVFLGNRVDYLITLAADGTMTVEQTGALGPAQKVSDGKDTLTHIERLQFADGPFVPAGSAALAPLGLAFPTTQQVNTTSSAVTATLSNTGLLPLHISAITITGTNSGDFAIAPGGTCGTPPTTLQGGSSCNINVTFKPTAGGARTATLQVTDDAGGTPGSTQQVGLSGTGSTTPPPNNPPTGLPLLSDSTPQVGQTLTAVTTGIGDLDGLGAFSFQWFQSGAANTTFTAIAGATRSTFAVPAGGVNRMYRVRVTYTDGAGHAETLTSANSARTTLLPNTTGRLNPTVPSAPGIGAVARGGAGNPVTASVNWTAPTDNGGVAITGYKVSAIRFAANGTTVVSTTVFNAGANARTLSMTLTAGATYRFQVRATNSVGDSALSARSGAVVPR